MRPVLLEMDGFASFRQRTVVDFDDVDYFVLVGPTGAGKSTVIDAIAFSLYGSVARWDDNKVVSPALAPTVNRGTVRLVFDVRGERYVVIRELRRSAAGNVQQKNVRLERLLDRTARGTVEDGTEVVSGTIADTLVAVRNLLGLDFDQFTKCVALPQGAFAEFLHAKPADRDKILTTLLGLEGYIRVGKIAGARAANLRTQADTLTAQLAEDLVRCDDAALGAAVNAHVALTALTTQVEQDVASLGEQTKALAEAVEAQRQHQQSLTLLSALSVPDGLDALDKAMATARHAAQTTTDAVQAAETADEQARGALRQQPARADLERIRDQHSEVMQLHEIADEVATRLRTTTDEQTQRDTAQRAAAAEHIAAQHAASAAATELEKADAQLAETATQLTLLDSAQQPSDLPDLLVDIQAADARKEAATARLASSKAEFATATTTTDALPNPVTLERANTSLSAAVTATGTTRDALATLTSAHRQSTAHADVVLQRTEALQAAETGAAALHSRLVAADLRAHLSEGHACPVCEQTVTAVPAPLDASDASAATDSVATARASLTSAEKTAAAGIAQLDTAARAASSAINALVAARALAGTALQSLPGSTATLPAAPAAELLDGITQRTSEELATRVLPLDAVLADLLTALEAAGATVIAAEQKRSAAETATRAAAEAVAAAEQSLTEAHQAGDDLAQRQQQARAALRGVRDPLVTLGAPAVDDTDLTSAWAALTDWAATTRAATFEKSLTDENAAAAAHAAHHSAQASLTAAELAHADASAAYETSVREHEQALAAQAQHKARLADLTVRLAEATDLATVTAQLDILSQLETAATSADAELTAARTARDGANATLARLYEQQLAAQAALSSARDPLVSLGAPPLPNTLTLADAWATLTDWATSQAASLQSTLTAATAQVEALTDGLNQAETSLRGNIADAGVDIGDPARSDLPAAQWATAAVAGAAATATAELDAIHAAQARSEKTQTQIRMLTEHAQVAGELARLLHINAFPRWLSRNALQVLVTAASETLMTLSGGQFELDLADTDASSFTVIDHTDADAVRPVKTLSGGETFQASLSLALALSRHLGALASNGAAQLDAIFIDEGFGTLDEHTLDTVANTLENLAASAGRMVGLITHVPALANRVPVRFEVRRDPRGSSISRVATGDLQ